MRSKPGFLSPHNRVCGSTGWGEDGWRWVRRTFVWETGRSRANRLRKKNRAAALSLPMGLRPSVFCKCGQMSVIRGN